MFKGVILVDGGGQGLWFVVPCAVVGVGVFVFLVLRVDVASAAFRW